MVTWQVHGFLERNAHARMLARASEKGGPVMPETVISQLHLWAKERHRLHLTRAYARMAMIKSATRARLVVPLRRRTVG